MQTLVLGKSSGRLIPTVGSGRYSPGPGMVKLLEEGSYQELRPRMAKCSLIPPGFLAIDSDLAEITDTSARRIEHADKVALRFAGSPHRPLRSPTNEPKRSQHEHHLPDRPGDPRRAPRSTGHLHGLRPGDRRLRRLLAAASRRRRPHVRPGQREPAHRAPLP